MHYTFRRRKDQFTKIDVFVPREKNYFQSVENIFTSIG